MQSAIKYQYAPKSVLADAKPVGFIVINEKHWGIEIRRSVILPPFTTLTSIQNTSEQHTWGFLHPECHGQNALLFFSWDLAKTIEQQFQLHAQSSLDVQLMEAQKAVDRLLNQYVQIQANPKAFEGQSITLHLQLDEEDEKGSAVLALHTSPELETMILEMQAQQQATRSIN